MSAVVYFEIPVDDLDRAMRFYGTVFKVRLERTAIDGNDMALFPADDADGAVAEFQDSEGNCIALHGPARPAG